MNTKVPKSRPGYKRAQGRLSRVWSIKESLYYLFILPTLKIRGGKRWIFKNYFLFYVLVCVMSPHVCMIRRKFNIQIIGGPNKENRKNDEEEHNISSN